MTYLASLTPNTIHAKAQQEAFARLNSAGRRVPVVFSHVLLTLSAHTNKTRKGAFNKLSQSSPDGSPRRVSTNSNQGGQKNSLPETGRLASVSMKSNSTNLFFILS